MPRSFAAPPSFDDHVAQALALIADQRPARPPRPMPRPPALARVIALPTRATRTTKTRRRQ
jgi:hypothetical protein